jgi:hypothetical protein
MILNLIFLDDADAEERQHKPPDVFRKSELHRKAECERTKGQLPPSMIGNIGSRLGLLAELSLHLGLVAVVVKDAHRPFFVDVGASN